VGGARDTHTPATRVGRSGVTSGAPPTRSDARGVRGHGASAPPRVGPSDGRHTHGWSREGGTGACRGADARSGARSPQTAIGATARQATGRRGGGWPLGSWRGGVVLGGAPPSVLPFLAGGGSDNGGGVWLARASSSPDLAKACGNYKLLCTEGVLAKTR